jgi:hypothetical protein
MQIKDLIYKYGHFYDKNTGERLGLKDGAAIRIEASKNDFFPVSAVGKWPKEIFNPERKESIVKSEPNLANCKKIYNQGTFLYFSISRRKNKKISITHEFQVELLEDLYVYLKSDRKQDRLYDCACTVIANISNTIDFFEPIRAKSLNEAYKNTFVHYFENKGNPACNALDRFYEKPGCVDLTIGENRITKK